MAEELLLIEEQTKWFLKMEATPGDVAVKIVDDNQGFRIFHEGG